MFSSNVVFEDFVLRSLDASPLIEPVLESFCRFEVRVHIKNIFFFLNLSHLRQVYLVVSKQKEQARSSFPAILFRMKSFAHAKSMERADLWDRYNLYNLYVMYAFGSAHVKFDV